MLGLKFTEILQRNRQLMLAATGKCYRVRILANITVNSIKDILDYALLSEGISPEVSIGNYDNIVQDSAQCQDQDMVIVFYDTFRFTQGLPVFFEGISESFYSQLYDKICNEIDMTLNNLERCASVVFNSFSSACFMSSITESTLLDRLTYDLNLFLRSRKWNNLTVLDLDKVFQRVGIGSSVDMRMFLSSKAPYTLTFFKHYAMGLQPTIRRSCGKLKKAIIFDCDNTLWKGILGEDGKNGVEMTLDTHAGEIFYKIQQIAVFLSQQGVLVGICSKNNKEDVVLVLEQAYLKNEYIVVSRINWNDKATNLREIANELNIGTDSLVFVDDSDFEINLVREKLPEVTCLQVPQSLFDYPNFLLENCYLLFNLTPNEEDKRKTEMYKTQAKREAAKLTASSIEDYLSTLNIVLNITIDDLSQIERIAQLTQKTNQFNLTTHRYAENQIEQFMTDQNSVVISAKVSDDFGDNGLTALAILRWFDSVGEIDTLLMSCRIIGRNIEYLFIDKIIEQLSRNGIKTIYATYHKTDKNTQVSDLYKKVGFSEISHDNVTIRYELKTEEYTPSNINYITILNE